ncbi:hypothetical protein MTR67_014409 [Solanum verrucosum]|uniref:Uncharacterized protein n=1 Tax=Solanum verrucosum TaxID=315347 RepID=A0AAF0TJ94_SOLVR|nr:hypothetical protein MTR67_014409 [Solanum verrucosum]
MQPALAVMPLMAVENSHPEAASV